MLGYCRRLPPGAAGWDISRLAIIREWKSQLNWEYPGSQNRGAPAYAAEAAKLSSDQSSMAPQEAKDGQCKQKNAKYDQQPSPLTASKGRKHDH
jgi:hypothetical protein